MAGEPTAMTQRGYLQSMAGICGDSLPAPPTDTALINWARAKGMSPGGGWNLDAALTREVMAYTMVQLLNLAPAKAKTDFDPMRILESQGIFIRTSGGHVTAQNFRRVIGDKFARLAMSKAGDDKDRDGKGGHGDDDDDDDGHPPSPTKPGHGHGDKNHDHTGPPGQEKGGKK